MEELLIEKKFVDMMLEAYKSLAQFPKSEKFALVTDIKRSMDTALRKITEANKKYYKKTTLQELDVEVALLKKYVTLSYKLGFLPEKKYIKWTESLVEIGRMTGGWIKSQQNAK